MKYRSAMFFVFQVCCQLLHYWLHIFS